MNYGMISIVLAAITIPLALRGTRGAAIGLSIAICVFWPEYLRISIGPANMSIPRLVALAIILRAFGRGDAPKPYYPDYLILFFWLWGTTCTFLNNNVAGTMTNRMGMFLDTVAIYWATRICIRNGEDIIAMSRWLCLAGIAAGVMGMVETTTGLSPYRRYIALVVMDSPFFANYVGPDIAAQFPVIEYRLGLLRSYGSTLVHITWGTLNLVMMGLMYPVVLDAMSRRRMTPLLWAGIIGAGLGLFSSLSAGPWAATFMMIGILIFQRWSFLLVPVVSTMLVIMGLVGLVGDVPPWYPAMRMIGLDANTAWYRSQLMTFIFTKVGEYGLMGAHGDIFDPWAMEIDGRPFLDVANHYLMVGLNSGVLGILLQVAIFGVVIQHLSQLYKTGGRRTRNFSYAIMALLLSFAINAVSVTYSDLMSVLLNFLLGIGMMEYTPETPGDASGGGVRAPASSGAPGPRYDGLIPWT